MEEINDDITTTGESSCPELTYAYETNPNSEELLKLKKEELKILKKKAAKDRAIRLANKSQKIAMRDDRIDKIKLRLQTIKDQMTIYNRAGKNKKDKIDILGNIRRLVENDVELLEEIETIKSISQEDIEAEAFVEPNN